jgi:hypothetical protein
MILFYAGVDKQKTKDPRPMVKEDLPIMTTFFSLRKLKKQRLLNEITKHRKRMKDKNSKRSKA